jgi:hypothetical protein
MLFDIVCAFGKLFWPPSCLASFFTPYASLITKWCHPLAVLNPGRAKYSQLENWFVSLGEVNRNHYGVKNGKASGP